MEQITDFFKDFLGTGDWPPRWYCGKWSEFHGWLYIISDFLIFAAYFTIPFLLIHFIIRKRDVPFSKLFWLFGAFIFACGATHLIDAIIFWFPVYKLSAVVRLITAIVSWGTIFALYRVLPEALSLKTPAELERIVEARTIELQASIQRSKFIADAMPQIVWTANPQGVVDYVNVQALAFSGLTQEQLLEWGWTQMLHPDEKERFMEQWQYAFSHLDEFEMEARLRNHGGRYVWYLNRALPHRDEQGNVVMWVGTATEIEVHKRTAEMLERRVAERTDQLREANERLVRSNADLESFASVASHDLQAPLRTIMTYLSMLEEKNAGRLDETSLRYISRSTEVGQRMRKLIDNLLMYARLNAESIHPEQVDLNEVMGSVLSNLHDTIEARHAKVIYGDLPVITADPTQMQQLLQNLVANGIHYNDRDIPKVTVAYADFGAYHQISITDNGAGISRENLDKVFEVFARFDASRKGSGLGLAIAKRIVSNHGGTIWVTSEPGVGTTFFFTIARHAGKA